MYSNEHNTAQTRCLAAISTCDITPPVGIYHRMWGAALHDQATGVHRPLKAHLLWLQRPTDSPQSVGSSQDSETDSQLIFSLDHCILDSREIQMIRHKVAQAVGLVPEQIQVSLTHTHGSGWMSRTRSHLPGGEFIGPYLDGLAGRLADLAASTQATLRPVTIVYHRAHCDLATNRDLWDDEAGQYVVGWNPNGKSDESLLVGGVFADDMPAIERRPPLAVIVNYACHPTTLAWDNTLLSPDWVGAMRELVEVATRGPCIFLQGASGDLGPKEGFVGDASVADRNGRQVGYAVLSALESLTPAGTKYCYNGSVLSGARIGTWEHRPLDAQQAAQCKAWRWRRFTVPLPYRSDLPTLTQTLAQREHWLQEEQNAERAEDPIRMRDCRAQVEQRTRQLSRLEALAPGDHYPLEVLVGLVGQAVWVLVPGELYQVFQTSLRASFPNHPLIIATLTNDWQPGYIPPAEVYGHDIYQEVIAATAPGSLELLIEQCQRQIQMMLAWEGQ